MGRKQRKKEKLLISSNFSFSHSVFKRLVLPTRKNKGQFGYDKSLAVDKVFDLSIFRAFVDNKIDLTQSFVFSSEESM